MESNQFLGLPTILIFVLHKYDHQENQICDGDAYAVWTMKRWKSHGLGNTLMHLLSMRCLKAGLPATTSYPMILLSAPADTTVCFWCNPATPMTAEVCRCLCKVFGFHDASSPSRSLQRMTAWSLPLVKKQTSSQGAKLMLLIMPLTWGLFSKKVTRSFCWKHQ